MSAVYIRIDRMGDLVLTLPVDEGKPDIHWFIPQGLGFLLNQSIPERKHTEFSRDFSWPEFHRMVQKLKELNPERVVIFHAPTWVYFAVRWAGIRERVGRLSQWYSFLLLNKGIRQSRSLGEKHETEYNWDLLARTEPVPEPLKLTARSAKPLNFPSKMYYVIHPGMGGSALNWPAENYISLIQTITKKSPVVITGTAADEPYLKPIRDALKNKSNVIWLDGKIDTTELMLILKDAKAVIAPSTGVVHLAASLGAPTVGLYSPIAQERSKRWGPRGEKVKVLDATAITPIEDSMKTITVEMVLKSIDELIR